MARGYTSFFQDPEEEERQRVLELLVNPSGRDAAGEARRVVELPELVIEGDPRGAGELSREDIGPTDEEMYAGREKDLARNRGATAFSAGEDEEEWPSDQDRAAQRREIDGDRDGEDKSSLFPDWQTLAALVLDSAANRGRGTGSIVASYASNQQANARERNANRARKEELQARAQGKASDPMALALAQQRADIASQNASTNARRAGTGAESLDFRKGVDAEKVDIGSQRNRTQLEMREKGAAASKRGALNESHELIDQTVDDAKELTRGRRETALDVEHERAPAREADAASRAAAVKKAQNLASVDAPSEQALQGRRKEGREEAKIEDQHALPEGYKEKSSKAWRSATADPTAANKHKEFLRSASSSLSTLDRMIELRQRHGAQVLTSEAGGEMNTLQSVAAGNLSQAANTASVQNDEWKRYAERLPSLAVQGRDVVDTLSGAIGQDRDSALNELKGARAAMQRIFDANMKVLGVERGSAGSSSVGSTRASTRGGAPASIDAARSFTPENSASAPPAGWNADGTEMGVAAEDDPLEKWRKRGVLR